MRIASAIVVALLVASEVAAQQDLAETLTFESPGRWTGGPPETLLLDTAITHGGRQAGRIVRTDASPQEFSAFSLSIPRTFAGGVLELRGWLRTEDVRGWAGLWLREDGRAGSVQFDNMERRSLSGTTGWTEYTITLPLDDEARTIVFGALLAGQGTIWVDDLALLVDGRPVWEAPPLPPPPAELDTEFDEGSRISARTLTPTDVEHLALLARVWGFAKYHHPRIRSGQVNWDNELFRVLPAVLDAADWPEVQDVLSAWLDRLGTPDPCAPCASLPPDIWLAPDLAWMDDRDALGEALSARIRFLYERRPASEEQYYVDLVPNVGNPVLLEARRPASGLPDPGYRLLALFRYWNVIQYWFPYRDLIDEPWDGVLAEFIPRVFDAGTVESYGRTWEELITRIDDSHAGLGWPGAGRPASERGELPFNVRWVEGRPVVVGYRDPLTGPSTAVRLGDVLVRIDDQPVDSLVEEMRPATSASNEGRRLRLIAILMMRGPPGPASLTVSRPEGEATLVVERPVVTSYSPAWDDLPGPEFQMLTDSVAYLKLSAVQFARLDEYMERAADAAVLVIDIRNYPSESVVFPLGSRLVTEPTEFSRFSIPDLQNPGAFRLGSPVVMRPAPPELPVFRGRVAILVNEMSQSQAEYTAMAFRASPNAVVVGSTTSGADGNVSAIPLPGGMSTAMSGIGVFYPDGAPTQRIGIVPDLEVRPTIEGVREGRDEVLEAAVSYLLGRPFRLGLLP